MEQQPRAHEMTAEECIAFAQETQARFSYYKAISEYNGKSFESLDEGMISLMEQAVGDISSSLRGRTIVASIQTPQGIIDRRLCGIGMNTDVGIVLVVRESPSHDLENISLADVAELKHLA